MCKPGDTSEDLKKEAFLLDQREGIGERRMNGNGNGRIWDAFWKLLSLLVIPWATFVSWGLWQVTSAMKVTEQMYKEHDRRIQLIEGQMAPENRFYRWDGEALDERLHELEALHPRQRSD